MGQPTHKQASLFGLSGKSSKLLTEKPEQTPQCLVPGPIQPPPPRGWFTGNPAAASCVSPADTGPLPGSLGNGRPGLRCSRGHRGRSGPFTASHLETAVDELGECVSGGADAESALLTKELGAAVNRFVRGLPARDAALFVGRYFYAEPVAALAQRCGMTPNHAAVRLSRVRRKLREYLEQEGLIEL